MRSGSSLHDRRRRVKRQLAYPAPRSRRGFAHGQDPAAVSRSGTAATGTNLAHLEARDGTVGAANAPTSVPAMGASPSLSTVWAGHMSTFERLDHDGDAIRIGRGLIPWRVFTAVPVLLDILVVTATSVVFALVYHHWRYHTSGDVLSYLLIGGLISLFFVVPNLVQRQYQIAAFTTLPRKIGGAFLIWNMAFLYATATIFLLKAGDELSRMTVLGTYVFGFIAVIAARTVLGKLIVRLMKTGVIAGRRVLLFGVESEVMRFARTYQPWNHGIQVVGMTTLTRPADNDSLSPSIRGEKLNLDLERAVATARALQPDDVFVIVPWADVDTIEKTLDSFMNIPVSIHLAPERILDRYTDMRISRVGNMMSLNLARPPLNMFEVGLKRAMDLVGAIVGMILLAPFLLLVALAIKLESKGPVLFRQTRYGFNQRPFNVYKFRSMCTLDNGAHVPQATANDPRITRVGRFIRRWNIDELPQLLNVLTGEMSLVGPRPHAVAHNRSFERRIALYARRHNVKPGITGWAQVNGWRGETDTEAKMQGRVEHDLYYIDNWTLWFDVRILILTLGSPKAYENAR